jgi:hypothetical protein
MDDEWGRSAAELGPLFIHEGNNDPLSGHSTLIVFTHETTNVLAIMTSSAMHKYLHGLVF